MIAEDFGPVVHNGHVRVLATESIAGTTVEGARARTARVYTGPKDPRGRGQRSPPSAHRHDHRHRGQTSETQELFDADKRPGEKCGLGAAHRCSYATQVSTFGMLKDSSPDLYVLNCPGVRVEPIRSLVYPDRILRCQCVRGQQRQNRRVGELHGTSPPFARSSSFCACFVAACRARRSVVRRTTPRCSTTSSSVHATSPVRAWIRKNPRLPAAAKQGLPKEAGQHPP